MSTWFSKKTAIAVVITSVILFGQFAMIEWWNRVSIKYMNEVSAISSIESLQQLKEIITAMGAEKIGSGPESVWRLPFPSRGLKIIISSEKDNVLDVNMINVEGHLDFKNVSNWYEPTLGGKILTAVLLSLSFIIAILLFLINEERGASLVFGFLFILAGSALTFVFWLKLGIF